jgi:hypothetical protein
MYRKEFAIGTKALHMIQDKLGVTLPDDEGAFIDTQTITLYGKMDMICQRNIDAVMQLYTKYRFGILERKSRKFSSLKVPRFPVN